MPYAKLGCWGQDREMRHRHLYPTAEAQRISLLLFQRTWESAGHRKPRGIHLLPGGLPVPRCEGVFKPLPEKTCQPQACEERHGLAEGAGERKKENNHEANEGFP